MDKEELVRWEKLENDTHNRYIILAKKPLTLKVFDEEGKIEHLIKEYEKFLCKMDAHKDFG